LVVYYKFVQLSDAKEALNPISELDCIIQHYRFFDGFNRN
jgi:hypothetical protein